jgi:hypothetical protein
VEGSGLEMKRLGFVIVTTLLGISAALAADPPMGVGLNDARPRNAGAYACKWYMAAMAFDEVTTVERLRIRLGVNEWFAGYIAALNDGTPVGDRQPPEDIAVGSFGWLYGYCQSHPSDKISDAAAAWRRKISH